MKGCLIFLIAFHRRHCRLVSALDNTGYVFTTNEPYLVGTFHEGSYVISLDTENWDYDEGVDFSRIYTDHRKMNDDLTSSCSH